MWHETTKYKKKTENYNEIFKQLQGELEDKEAKITLAKFLRQNLYLTTYLLTGIKLSAYQEITLKGMFNRNFTMCVWGRGCAKSFTNDCGINYRNKCLADSRWPVARSAAVATTCDSVGACLFVCRTRRLR